MTQVWRLLDTGVRTAAENMALDHALLVARAEGLSPNTVRFLQFSPPAALVGFHQDVAQEIRVAYCREAGIDINRRLTGGGAILFDESQLGWELIASTRDAACPPFSVEMHRRVCSAVVEALRAFGLEAAFRPRNDIEIDGRKISGTGGVEEGDAFLFQGTLLLDFDIAAMVRALRVPTDKLKQSSLDSAADRVTWLARELGRLPPLDSIKQAIARGFEETFRVRLEPAGLTHEEDNLFRKLLPQFKSNAWVERREVGQIANLPAQADGLRHGGAGEVPGQDKDTGWKPVPPRERKGARSHVETFHGLHRNEGAVIRAAAQVDVTRRRLRAVVITGDFFISPRRAIFDIEARLKDHRLDEQAISQTISRTWREGNVHAAGFGPEDIAASLRAALDKMQWLDRGLSAEEANRVFTTNGTAREVLAQPISLVLLPYCSKRPDCALRHEEACEQCGDCTVGEAWTLAERYGVRPVTIVSFEHLMETLARARREGVEAYIGCCCEAFFQKHFEDFCAARLPGILIDIHNATCYDLNQQHLAYKGDFEHQTHLDLALLEKILVALHDVHHGQAPSTDQVARSELRIPHSAFRIPSRVTP